MAKVYVLSLDDEVPLSEGVIRDLKEVAYLLFGEIDKYDRQILIADDKKYQLIKNELLESYTNGKYNYRFESELSNTPKYLYEPFLVNDRTFAFTTYEGSVTEDEIMQFLTNVFTFLGVYYKFNIDSLYYDEETTNGRISAYNFLVYGSPSPIGIQEEKDNIGKVKKKARASANSIFSLFYK